MIPASHHVDRIRGGGNPVAAEPFTGEPPRFIVDTLAVLQDFRHLAALVESALDESTKQHLIEQGKAAWLALEPYLPKEQPTMEAEHYDAIRRFRELLASCLGGQSPLLAN